MYCYNLRHSNITDGFLALWDTVYDVRGVVTVAMLMLLSDSGPYSFHP
jgi:hypothetical protein